MSRATLSARPVVILGAARSGTKIFRDCLGVFPGVATVPYDINYVWRMGSEKLTHDEIPASAATDATICRIRAQLARFVLGADVLVEKTVSNCLRVEYVDRVLPDALFVHLIRDGRDVVESVERQWTEKPDYRYLAWKVRTYPWFDAPRYALEYVPGLVRRQFGRRTGAAVWGPRYAGIQDDLLAESVQSVCARQWVRCVELASAGLSAIPAARVATVRYEEFARDPAAVVAQVAAFAGLGSPTADFAVPVTEAHIGKGHGGIDAAALAIMRPTLQRLGYADDI